MWNKIKNRPGRTQAAIVAFTLLLTLFGVPWSELQLAAVNGLAATLIALFLEPVKLRRNTDV